MPLHAPTRRSGVGRLSGLSRRVVATLALIGAAVFVGGVTAPTASAAPFEFVLSSGNPDFAFQKAGGVQIRTFDLLNSGDNDISIDPTPLMAMTAPFAASAISFTKTTVIPHNTGHATFTITYTVPAVGTVSTVPVDLVATDQTDNSTKSLLPMLVFKGTSIATDPAHYTATNSAGASMVDFGALSVGASRAEVITLRVDGVLPIRFSTNNLALTDGAGSPLTSVAVTASSFGSVGAVTVPGGTATFELTYTPTAAGALTGNVSVAGFAVSGTVETSVLAVVLPLSGSASAVTPTTPPTTAPATPAATGTPLPTSTGTSTSGVGSRPGTGSGSGTGNGTGSLAETGAPVVGIAGLGMLVGLVGFGVIAGLAVARRRRQQKQ